MGQRDSINLPLINQPRSLRRRRQKNPHQILNSYGWNFMPLVALSPRSAQRRSSPDIQAGSQPGRQTSRQAGRQAGRSANWGSQLSIPLGVSENPSSPEQALDRQANKQAGRHAGKQVDIQSSRQTRKHARPSPTHRRSSHARAEGCNLSPFSQGPSSQS